MRLARIRIPHVNNTTLGIRHRPVQGGIPAPLRESLEGAV
jgi:hypothetical protein